MADTPDLIEEQAKLISRSNTLAELTPEITKWFGDLNSYVRVMYNDKTELLRVLREAEAHFTTIGQYLSDIERFPEITGVNFLDFSVLHDEVLDNPDSVKAKLGIKKSEEYMNVLFPFLDEIYTSLFSDVSGNFQTDLKDQIVRNLDIFRLYLSPRFKTNTTFKSYIVYPYFVYVLFTLLSLTFKLLSDLQEESWKNLSVARQAELKAMRDSLIEARQQYRDEHSNSAFVFSKPDQTSETAPTEKTSTEQTVSERAREVAEQYKKESRNSPLEISIEDYLNKEPSSRKLIEMAAKNAALFEKVPTEYLELVRRELRNAPISVQTQMEGYFDTLRLSEQAVLIAVNGGKLPQYLDLDDSGDPKLQALIKETQGDVLQTIALLRGKTEKTQLSPEKFNKLIIQKFGVTQENIVRYEKESNAISDKQSEQYRQLQLALADERDILTAQQSFYQAQNFQQLSTTQRVKVIFNQIRRAPTEIVVDPESRIIDGLGFDELSIPSDAQENFVTMDDGSRSSMLSALRVPFRGRNKKDTIAKIAETQKSVKTLGALLKSPAFLAGAGVGGGAALLVAGFTSQLPGVMGAGGALAGASAGAFIGSFFGGIGAIPGFIIGGAVGGITGGGGAYLYGRSLFPGSSAPLSNAASTLGQIGQQGLNAAGNLTPSTITNASTTLSSTLSGAQAGLNGAANAALSGSKAFLAALPSTGTGLSAGTVSLFVATPIVSAIAATVIVTLTNDSAFLIPGNIASCQETHGVRICKSNDIIQSPDPTEVTYTIKVEVKEGISITIKDVKDTFEIRRSTEGALPTPPVAPAEILNTLVNQTVTSATPLEVTYKMPFGPEFADTQVINTVRVGYTTGSSSNDASATSNVIFGVVAYGGCWPATGTIKQGPFALRTHCLIDAIDIYPNDESGGPNGPIFTPLAGTAKFYCQTDGGCTTHYAPIYGNAVIVTTPDNKRLVFGHMSRFADPYKGGDVVAVEKGTQIGYMGNTGTGQQSKSTGAVVSFSEHLHYEYTNNNIGTCSEPFPASRLFEDGVVPEPVELNEADKDFRVPKTQRVRYDACGTTAGAPDEGKEVASVSCFSFKNGNKNWIVDGNRTQLDQYVTEMRKLLALPNVNDALCGDGKSISIIRHETDNTRTDDGCNFDGTGEAGAEWTGPLELQVCDKLYANPDIFGVNTMWHEPGHAFQHKHLAWKIFPDFSPNYLPTYPLTKTKNEDFAEAFGLCLFNLNRRANFMTDTSILARFRNQDVSYNQYKDQCSALEPIIQNAAATANNASGF